MLKLHGVEIPTDKPYSVILLEMRTANLNRRVYGVQGMAYQSPDTQIFVYGDLKHCHEEFTWIRDRIIEAGLYAQEVGQYSIYVPRHLLVNCTPQMVTKKIMQVLRDYPKLKEERRRVARRLAAYNKHTNGAANEKATQT